MRILIVVGICVAALLTVLLLLVVRIRLLTLGGGTIRLQVRVGTRVPGRGWSTGVGRFADDELRFHRMFSFALRPKRVIGRRGLRVEQRRLPDGPERLSMPGHWVILRCRTDRGPVEIAMATATATGFLSWLEAGPPDQPGTTSARPAARPAER